MTHYAAHPIPSSNAWGVSKVSEGGLTVSVISYAGEGADIKAHDEAGRLNKLTPRPWPFTEG